MHKETNDVFKNSSVLAIDFILMCLLHSLTYISQLCELQCVCYNYYYVRFLKTFLYAGKLIAKSTLKCGQQRFEGFPYGSFLDYAADQDGSLILSISSLAPHRKV